jgi:hypothetical protein
MEKIDVKKTRCQAKILGTAVTVAGAMLMTLYKGPLVELVWSKHVHSGKPYETTSSGSTYDKDFIKGTMFLIIATLAWAGLFVLQVSDHAKRKKEIIEALSCF